MVVVVAVEQCDVGQSSGRGQLDCVGCGTDDLHLRVISEINNCLSLFHHASAPQQRHPEMESSPAPSDRNDRHDDFPENRDLKRTKVAHEVTTSREGTHGPASSDGHRSPAPSTSRATSVGSPEKPKSESGSLVKSVVKKNAKSKKAPDSGNRKVGKRSSSKVCLVVGATCLCSCVVHFAQRGPLSPLAASGAGRGWESELLLVSGSSSVAAVGDWPIDGARNQGWMLTDAGRWHGPPWRGERR